MGFTPQLVDWDGDGRADVLTGSATGEIVHYRQLADGRFAAGEPLKDRDGRACNVGHSAAAFATDWDADGDLDLLVGTGEGKVYFFPREPGPKTSSPPTSSPPTGSPPTGSPPTSALGEPQPLEVDAKAVGDFAAPVAADWDGDGRLDLLVGTGAGSVLWWRNIGTSRQPQLAAPKTLVPPSPGNDAKSCGTRAKICVADFNGDGRADLLLGDVGSRFEAKPAQTAEERAAEQRAQRELPQLRNQWAAAYQEYRRIAKADDAAERAQRIESLRGEISRLKQRIAAAQEVLRRFEPQPQSHGYVWVFLRKAPATEPKANAP